MRSGIGLVLALWGWKLLLLSLTFPLGHAVEVVLLLDVECLIAPGTAEVVDGRAAVGTGFHGAQSSSQVHSPQALELPEIQPPQPGHFVYARVGRCLPAGPSSRLHSAQECSGAPSGLRHEPPL